MIFTFPNSSQTAFRISSQGIDCLSMMIDPDTRDPFYETYIQSLISYISILFLYTILSSLLLEGLNSNFKNEEMLARISMKF